MVVDNSLAVLAALVVRKRLVDEQRQLVLVAGRRRDLGVGVVLERRV